MGPRRSRSLRCLLNVALLLLGSPVPCHPKSDSRNSSPRPRRSDAPLWRQSEALPPSARRDGEAIPPSGTGDGQGDSSGDRGGKEGQSEQTRWARAVLSRSGRWWGPHRRRNLFRWVRAGEQQRIRLDVDGLGEGNGGWEEDASEDGRFPTARQRWRDSPDDDGDGTEESATHYDSAARGLVERLGWVVAVQSFVTLLTANSNHLLFEIMSQILSEETAVAIRKIQNILVKAYDDGLADVFTRTRPADLWTAVYAWSRLQNASFRYDAMHGATSERSCRPDLANNVELLKDLARYAVYANAAYGSMMDVAFGGGFHLRDNLQNLLLRTRTPKGDVIAVHRDAKRHPAYFLLRDRVRKRIVLCLRGTWTAHDVLNDLCCEADDLTVTTMSLSYFGGRRASSRTVRAHHGMLLAAKAIQEELQDVLEAEFKDRPDYSLVLVGHSMGGGVAALLGSIWERTFPGTFVYAFGAPCVTSIQAQTSSVPVVSVLHELDPFSRMSLGHVADVSIGITLMCKDTELRDEVISRTSRPFDEMPLNDLKWCSETMSRLRSTHLTSEKLYPPGRILLLASLGTASRPRGRRRNRSALELRDVPAEYFQDLLIRPRIFDLTRHAPASYVHWLQQVQARGD